MKRFSAILFFLIPALIVSGCSKGSQTTSSQSAAPEATASPSGPPMSTQMRTGMSTYNLNCATCHGAKGQGQVGAFPPLDGNGTVTGDPKAVIRIVKLGLKGPMRMKGVMYNGQMPAWNGSLSDEQIAAVVTYIRGAWTNAAPAVSTAQVTAEK